MSFQTVPLTPEHKRKMEETMSMLTVQAPGFLHLLYSCLNHQSHDGEFVMLMSKDVPIAATDGMSIIVNPDTYFAMGLPERVFVAAHEVVHNMYFDVELLHKCIKQNHVLMPDGRKLPFDNDCMQRAKDARINALLIESKIGKMPACGILDKEVKGGDSVYPIYERYLNRLVQGGGKPGEQPGNRDGNKPGNGTTPGSQPKPGNQPAPAQAGGNPNGGFDKLLEPGEATGNPREGGGKQDKERWAVEIEAARQLEEIAAQGNLPAGMERMFKELLTPEISWLDHIETLVKRQVGDGGVDWTQPHAWYGDSDDGQYFYPSDTGYGCGWVVVWGDTSGSMSDSILAKNIAELAGLMEQVNPKRLTLIWCDAGLKDGSVEELTDAADLRSVKPVGGGGTNYQPVLDWITKNGRGELPDLMVCFTDGYVTFAKVHPFPTVWASSTPPGTVKYPFGSVVYINNLQRAA